MNDCENFQEKCSYVFNNLEKLLNKFLKKANIPTLDNIHEIIASPETDTEHFKEVTSSFFREVEYNILKCQESDKKRVKQTIKSLQNNSDRIIVNIENINETAKKTVNQINLTDNNKDIEYNKKILNSAITEFMEYTETVKKEIVEIKSKLHSKLNDLINLDNEIEQMKKKMFRDELTGLLNRRGLAEVYYSLMNDENRTSFAVEDCIMFIDIDKFKNINDKYGHIAGDLIIKYIGKILHSSLRENDLIGRIYGDEFLIIFKKTKIGVAKSIAERLRKKIEKAIFYYKTNPIKVTISAGLCKINKWNSFDETIEHVDKLMYEAKQEGNKIIFL